MFCGSHVLCRVGSRALLRLPSESRRVGSVSLQQHHLLTSRLFPNVFRLFTLHQQPTSVVPPLQALQISTPMSASPYTFDAQDADVILRAPLQPGLDEFKDFHTHKLILSIASTFFHDMFNIPQPPQSAMADITLPVIHVTEPPEVFETFLRLIYPVDPPVIEGLLSVDTLFQIADKYLAKSVTMKLAKLLLLPSFLKDDPIWVYAIARRANLNKEAELAIAHTFTINLVGEVSRTHLQTMTAEAYNSLLMSHAVRRVKLVSVLDQAKFPMGSYPCICHVVFCAKVHKNITIAIWEYPFLDRRRLDSCLPIPTSTCGRAICGVTKQTIDKYFTDILDGIGKLE